MLSAFKTLEQQLSSRVVGAKTRAVRLLASMVQADFQRIQFTPDLLPSDVTGTEIFRPEDGSFEFQPGPVFNSLVLADEVNRAPAKVQSALLEAMSEGQVSIGRHCMELPDLFMVMATQNPIEQEGTYALPEAQLDRFLMQIVVDYPEADVENAILDIAREEATHKSRQYRSDNSATGATDSIQILSQADIFAAREQILQLHMSDSVQQYLVQLVLATRTPERINNELASLIDYGASPRASIALDRAARARAWLQGRDYVTPDDIAALLHDCLRHRLVLSLEAEASGVRSDDVIDQIASLVPAG